MLRHFAPLTLALLLAACGDGEPLLPADAVLPDGGRYRGEVVDGRLQGEEREVSIGLTKDKQGDSKVRIDGTDGHKVAELAHLTPKIIGAAAITAIPEHGTAVEGQQPLPVHLQVAGTGVGGVAVGQQHLEKALV